MRAILTTILAACLALVAAPAAAQSWQGGGGNANWSTGANWSGGAPFNGVGGLALFTLGSAPLASTVDVAWALTNLQLFNFNWAISGQPLTLTGTGTLTQLGGAPTITNNVILSGARTFDIGTGLTLGNVSGTGTLTKTGAGTLTIGTLQSTGQITIDAGKLVASPFPNANFIANVTVNGTLETTTAISLWRALSGNGTVNANGPIHFSQFTDSVFTGTISAASLLGKDGTGKLTLTGNNDWGDTLVSGGTLQIGNGVSGTYPNHSVGVRGSGTVIFNLPPAGTANVFTAQNSINVVVMSGAVTHTSVALPWNTTGNTTVTGGSFQTLVMNSPGNLMVSAPGTWTTGTSSNVGSLSGSGQITANGEIRFGSNGADTTFSGTIGPASGLAPMEKLGPGTHTLSGTVGLAGPMHVSGGTLRLQGGTTGQFVYVYGGTTLSGSGNVNAVVVNGGTFAPQAFSASQLISDAGGTISFSIEGTAPGTQHSQVVVSLAPYLPNLTLALTGSFVPSPGQSFTLIRNDHPSFVPVGTFNGLPEGSVFTFNGVPVKLSYVGGTGNDVVLSYAAHDVTPSVTGSGTTSPGTVQSVLHQATASFLLTPAANYHLVDVGGTCPQGSLVGMNYTTGQIVANCTVVANFASDTRTVTPSAGPNGTISPTSPQTVNYGSTQQLTVTPATGYSATIGGTCPAGTFAPPTYTTGAIVNNCTVTATFTINSYSVTPSAGANGSISPTGPQNVNHGSSLQFTVTPSVGYSATMGGTCPIGTLNGATYTTGAITAHCTVTAAFTINTYTVTPSAGANGTISPTGAQSVNHGDTVQFTVTPSAGYTAAMGGTCSAGTLNGATYTTGAITANCTVSVAFTLNTYTVTPSAGAGGTISPNTSQPVGHGGTLQFIVTPAAGHTASMGGTCGGSLVGNTYTTAAVTANCTVAATFIVNQYTVTPSSGANGAISPMTPQAIAHGMTMQFTVTPNAGYAATLGGTCPAGSLAGTLYTTGVITGDCTVTATFAIAFVTYNIVLEGWQLIPYVETPASGGGTAIFNPVNNQLQLDLAFSGLEGAEYYAYINGPAVRGLNGDYMIVLPAGSPKSLTLALDPAQASQLATGQLYVNISSTVHPSGELRGQIDHLGSAPRGTLTVTKAGVPGGRVLGGGAGGLVIDCGDDCDAVVPDGRTVILQAVPDGSSLVLVGWSGCDSVANGVCTLTMAGDRAVTATFGNFTSFTFPIESLQVVTSPYLAGGPTLQGQVGYNPATRLLVVSIDPNGLIFPVTSAHLHGPAARGANGPEIASVDSFFADITLTPAQETMLLAGQLYVDLHASGFPQGILRGQLDTVGSVARTLTVTRAGAGTGTVTGTTEPGTVIDCGSDCEETVPHGKVVTLAASAAAGSAFTGWSGACAGTGACVVTMDGAKSVTATFAIAAAPNPPRLGNISTRMQVLTGNDVMIGGFVIGGSTTKRVAIVATGPSLAAFGITNPLANPTITLVRSSDQATLATSDDWQSAANAADLTAAGFAPSNALEAAILIDLAPGAYTAIVSGVGNGTGVSVIGVYEVSNPQTPLTNISTRGRVLTGNDVMIGGFVVNGAAPKTLAIVATGPSLAAYGITSPLANPMITVVRSSDQAVVASNDDWQTGANAAQLTAAGFAPTDPLEAALLLTLPPGAYTVIVQGAGGGTGVAVIGVYAVN